MDHYKNNVAKLCTELSPDFFKKPVKHPVSRNSDEKKVINANCWSLGKEKNTENRFTNTDAHKKTKKDMLEDLFKRAENDRLSLQNSFTNSMSMTMQSKQSAPQKYNSLSILIKPTSPLSIDDIIDTSQILTSKLTTRTMLNS